MDDASILHEFLVVLAVGLAMGALSVLIWVSTKVKALKNRLSTWIVRTRKRFNLGE